eukprot:CAMPEP_0113547190 /NCGR_PEP_ID=MMETSP0015_2-20120614/12220_1 /TAXON_ID=2838 /ORGANISM="Odontella" /LENGTH=462 /DNA_ID=CAMNT_0000447721 /DNA_START=362 /DNA_END=1750 /DNA_ORIENTATION=+ /assembly_acc=CAM_ASM_000160
MRNTKMRNASLTNLRDAAVIKMSGLARRSSAGSVRVRSGSTTSASGSSDEESTLPTVGSEDCLLLSSSTASSRTSPPSSPKRFIISSSSSSSMSMSMSMSMSTSMSSTVLDPVAGRSSSGGGGGGGGGGESHRIDAARRDLDEVRRIVEARRREVEAMETMLTEAEGRIDALHFLAKDGSGADAGNRAGSLREDAERVVEAASVRIDAGRLLERAYKMTKPLATANATAAATANASSSSSSPQQTCPSSVKSSQQKKVAALERERDEAKSELSRIFEAHKKAERSRKREAEAHWAEVRRLKRALRQEKSKKSKSESAPREQPPSCHCHRWSEELRDMERVQSEVLKKLADTVAETQQNRRCSEDSSSVECFYIGGPPHDDPIHDKDEQRKLLRLRKAEMTVRGLNVHVERLTEELMEQRELYALERKAMRTTLMRSASLQELSRAVLQRSTSQHTLEACHEH